MKTLAEMTGDQFVDLMDNYFAPPQKRTKLTQTEITNLAEKLNKKINVPLIRETKEEKILIKIIVKIDNFLYDNLPNEFYDLIRTCDNGIDDEEAKRLTVRLAKLANDKINIPYIPEICEGVAFRFIIGITINAARKGWNMTIANKKSDDIPVPNDQEASDKALASMIIDKEAAPVCAE